MAREREEEARRADEHADRRRAAASEWPQAGLAGDDQAAFDPYRVLGLAAGATVGQVRAAYEEARQKYDPQQVAHLGDDVQTHYAEKSRAAERAYQMLAGDAEAPPVEAAAEFSRAADYSAARLPAM
jgi:DnaJ-domain-containing protein 1